MKYGLSSVTVIVVKILQNFSVYTDVKLSDIKLKASLTQQSVNGFHIKIRPRNKKSTVT